MKYKYITVLDAQLAAREGEAAAIKCSALKWWHYGTCTEVEYNLHPSISRNCALCFHHNQECWRCPLESCDLDNSTYGKAAGLSIDYDRNQTKTNFRKFQQKARKLARIIERLSDEN